MANPQAELRTWNDVLRMKRSARYGSNHDSQPRSQPQSPAQVQTQSQSETQTTTQTPMQTPMQTQTQSQLQMRPPAPLTFTSSIYGVNAIADTPSTSTADVASLRSATSSMSAFPTGSASGSGSSSRSGDSRSTSRSRSKRQRREGDEAASSADISTCMNQLVEELRRQSDQEDDCERFGRFLAGLRRRKPVWVQPLLMNEILALSNRFNPPPQAAAPPCSSQGTQSGTRQQHFPVPWIARQQDFSTPAATNQQQLHLGSRYSSSNSDPFCEVARYEEYVD